jgi:hypothetical protein
MVDSPVGVVRVQRLSDAYCDKLFRVKVKPFQPLTSKGC